MKRKHPKDHIARATHSGNDENQQDDEGVGDDISLPEIVIDSEDIPDDEQPMVDLTVVDADVQKNTNDIFINLTGGKCYEDAEEVAQANCMEADVLITADAEINSNEGGIIEGGTIEDIPDRIYWESMLASLEQCESWEQLENLVFQLLPNLKPLRKRTMPVHFMPDVDFIDATAMQTIPADGPENVDAIRTTGDGNCLGRSVSKGYCGSELMHMEIHAKG